MTLQIGRNFREGGRTYRPGDTLPELDAATTDWLLRRGYLWDDRGIEPIRRKSELIVVENPDAKNDPRGQWIQPGEGTAERERRLELEAQNK